MKKFYSKTGILLFTALTLICNIYGQTTYTWIGANNASWTTSTNWSPTRSAPAANDILQFTDGTTKNVTSVPTQTIGRLLVNSNTNITLQSAGTITLTVGNGTGDDIVIAVGSSLTIGGSNTLTLSLNTNATADISGTLTINTNRIFSLTNNGVVATVSGSIINSSSSSNGINGATATKLLFTSAASYEHAVNGGTIPTATWDANSTCNITGTTSTLPGGVNQSFGHFIWDATGQTNNLNLEPNGMSMAGNFSILSTGIRRIRIANTGTNRSLSVGQNFSQSGGIFVVVSGGGNVILSVGGNFSQSGGNFLFKEASGAATLNITGNFSMTGGSFDQRSSNTSSTAIVTVSGNFSLTNGTYDICGVGAVGLLNIAGNFSHTGGTITETSAGNGDIVFNGDGIQNFTSGGTVSNSVNFTINSGSILQMATAGTIVSGDGSFNLLNGGGICITSVDGITNSGASGNIQVTGTRSYNAGGTYIYNGNTSQVNGNGLPSSVNKLTINNSAGVVLTQAVAINGETTFTNGILTTTNSNLLIINDNATLSGVSNSSYVNGPVRKVGDDSFTFPIGKAGVYTPMSISAPANVTDAFTGEYFLIDPKTLGTSITASGLIRIGECEYWQLDQTAGSSNVNVTLSWSSASSCVGATYITDLATLTIAHFNGTSWDLHGNSGGTTGTVTNGTITWNNVSAFSPFTLGSTSSLSNPLPVKFGDFKAYEKQTGVQIEWNTYSENNVDHFEIQRSADGRTFSTIGQLNARNLNNRSDYSWFDASPFPANNYYRIKSIDKDGKTDFTSIVKINFKKTNMGINIYPNPVLNKQLSLQASNLEKGEYVLIVSSSSGQQVYRKTLSVNGGAISQSVKLPPTLMPGMYSLQLVSKVTVLSKAFIVQ